MLKRVRFWTKYSLAFISRFSKIIIGGAILGIVFYVLLNVFQSGATQTKTQVIGITGRYHADTLPVWVQNLIGDGLTQAAEDGSPVPNLATKWETEDGQTWTFTIDTLSSWHDGSLVKAQDILYKFSDVDIQISGNDTIVFKLKDPFAPFPSTLTRSVFKRGLLGTGDWKVDKINLQASFVESLRLRDKQKNTLIIKFYPSDDATKLAFKLGKINIIHETLNPEPFDTWATASLSAKIDTQKYVGLFFNTTDPIVSDKSLRQALNYAIDKESLGALRAVSPISPSSWAYNPLVKKYEYDIQRSKQLISDLPNEQLQDLKITLVTLPSLLDTAEKIVELWGGVGINAEVQVSAVPPTEFQALLAIHEIPQDPDQYAIWHSTQLNTNITNYQNPRIDKLLEDGRKTTDTQQRKAAYIDFQRFLVEDSPAIFLYHPTTYTISRK